MRRVLIAMTLAALMASCRTTTAPPVQLTVSLQANTSVVSRGDTVTFTVIAAANNLFGVIIDYGDTTTDQYSTAGASTARVTFKHAYSAAGSYTVRAVVTDALVGDKEASVAVVVN